MHSQDLVFQKTYFQIFIIYDPLLQIWSHTVKDKGKHFDNCFCLLCNRK